MAGTVSDLKLILPPPLGAVKFSRDLKKKLKLKVPSARKRSYFIPNMPLVFGGTGTVDSGDGSESLTPMATIDTLRKLVKEVVGESTSKHHPQVSKLVKHLDDTHGHVVHVKKHPTQDGVIHVDVFHAEEGHHDHSQATVDSAHKKIERHLKKHGYKPTDSHDQAGTTAYYYERE